MVCLAALLLLACGEPDTQSVDATTPGTAGVAGAAGGGAAGASGGGAAGASGAGAAGASGAGAAGASGGGAAGASGAGAAGASGASAGGAAGASGASAGGAAGASGASAGGAGASGGGPGAGAAGAPPKLTCEQVAAQSCKQASGYGCGPPSPKLPDVPWSCSTAATCPMVWVAQGGDAAANSKDGLKCSLQALRDRTPGGLQFFVPFFGSQFGTQMNLEILPDGRVLEITTENKDVCFGLGYRGPVTPKPPEFFESCLAGKGTSDYACLFGYANGC